MTQISIEIPNQALRSKDDQLSQAILEAAALQLYLEERLPLKRAARLANLSQAEFQALAGEPAPATHPLGLPPTPMESLQGSRYLARVLWALSEGKKRGLTPMTAAEIANFVCSHSDLKIEQTNTARFFRDSRKTGKFEQYWSTSDFGPRRAYTITDQGQQLLTGNLVPS